MRHIREVLRLRLSQRLSFRDIQRATHVARSTVCDYVQRAAEAGVTWEKIEPLDDAQIAELLYGAPVPRRPACLAPVDGAWVHQELRRAGVTLWLLWQEYAAAVRARQDGTRPYGYSRFCQHYTDYRRRLHPTMRLQRVPGERLFIDFSGKRPEIIDPHTGEVCEVELFVAVMGASSRTFACAVRSQRVPDFIEAVRAAIEFFGAVPHIVVPDNLKSAVTKADRFEPQIQQTFAEFGQHYGCAIVPARPHRPKDKAPVEAGVRIAQRWILGRLRHRQFFSLAALNEAIREQIALLDNWPSKTLGGTRRALFDALDAPAMKPLPPHPFEAGAWRFDLSVPPDYHVQAEIHLYSVPCAMIGERVDVRVSSRVVEAFHLGRRVAVHERAHGPYRRVVTDPRHRPRSHAEYGDWSPERLERWAASIGPGVHSFACSVLRNSTHPELRYRALFGLFRLAKTHGHARLDAACARALALGSLRYRSVAEILKRDLDLAPMPSDAPCAPTPPPHENVRGGQYFDREEIQP